ncbi:MAG: M28 family peptidase [Flavobacteriales bacterium]|jgi:Zn-dependent M28 family amino/carboxypeptidase|nr:M28 family peptidase [Flavobacteriales bacterium]
MKAENIRLYTDVEFLTTVSPARNYQNLNSLNKVANYIINKFGKLESNVIEQKWIADNNEYKNIIVKYNPEKKKRLIVGAHYDVCGNQPGADDNASAVAGLLETARLVFGNKPNLDYGIDFVAYCLEEPPFFGTELMGSYVHAKSLYDSNTEVMGMVCYEMIGYFSDEPNSQPFPTPELASLYPSTANFIVVVGIQEHHAFNMHIHEQMSIGSAIDVQVISFPSSGDLAGLSDHRNYWKFGYPALMINDTSFIRNPNYHEQSDTIDTLDFDKMTEVVNSSYRAIKNISIH